MRPIDFRHSSDSAQDDCLELACCLSSKNRLVAAIACISYAIAFPNCTIVMLLFAIMRQTHQAKGSSRKDHLDMLRTEPGRHVDAPSAENGTNCVSINSNHIQYLFHSRLQRKLIWTLHCLL